MSKAEAAKLAATGASHHQAGRLPQAESSYRQCLGMDPGNFDALRLLGGLLLQTGRAEAAVPLLQGAIEVRRNVALVHYQLGDAYRMLRRFEEAAASYRQVLNLQPNFAEAYSGLAACKVEANLPLEAIELMKQAIALKGTVWQFHMALGDLSLKSGNYPTAAEHLLKAVALLPQVPQLNQARAAALGALGSAQFGARDVAGARASFQQAMTLVPQDTGARLNHAEFLNLIGETDASIAGFRETLERDPGNVDAMKQLGLLLPRFGEHGEAVALLRRAVQLRPSDSAMHSGLLATLNYLHDLPVSTLMTEHVEWGRKHAATASNMREIVDRDPDRKLRIGYVSADFRRHAVASFIVPLIEHHDRDEVEIFCYSDTKTPDDVTATIGKMCRRFCDTRQLNAEQFGEQVKRDDIDILVDLSAHTADGRLLAFARRLAPIQVTYLGYPATTGVPAMDYRLTDANADPAESEHAHTERLARVDGCFLCFQPLDRNARVAASPARANGYVTFGSFNNTMKITPPTVALWSATLNRVKDSRLVIKSLKMTDAKTRERLIEYLASGIARERVTVLPPTSGFDEHLSGYSSIDIALDTFPYNGTTTTCEALWMGVPVVTLAGDRHASRVGASILSAVGRSEWVAADAERYAEIAASLASELPDREALRADIEQSRLMNAVAHARAIESAYRQMWRTACAR